MKRKTIIVIGTIVLFLLSGLTSPTDGSSVKISGGAYFYPETSAYRASFSMDVSQADSAPPAGWLKYYYTRSRMNVVSTGITKIEGSKDSAMVYGTCTINGAGTYAFTASIQAGTPDVFGIVIKKQEGGFYYSAGPKAIAGGDLVIKINRTPVANAGPDQTVFVGEKATLDGSRSSDADGDPLAFTWAFTSIPSGSGATLSNFAAIQPTFDADKPGTYVVRLIVNDGTVNSSPDTVNITANLRMTTVPNVTGITQAAAEAALQAANLKVGTVTTANSPSVPIGNVISQDPAAGFLVAQGSAVDLVVSLGPSTQPPGVISVGPEGGTLQFPNGVILDIPPGAVTETVDIEIADLPCEQIDAMLSSQELATHKKRCLRGFSAKPKGLVFNVPIKAIVPAALEPGEIPVRIGVNMDQQKQWLTEAELVYRGIDRAVEMSLKAFSGPVPIPLTQPMLSAGTKYVLEAEYTEVDYWLAVLLEHMDEVCKHCSSYIEGCGRLDLPHPFFHGLQPGACQILKDERERCAPGVRCCMEELMEITVTDVYFSSGECQIAGGKVVVKYPTCEGSPTIAYEEAGAIGCPEGMTFELKISADRNIMFVCEQATLKAEISGKSKDGTVLLEPAAFPARWDIVSGDSVELGADIPPDGKVATGKKRGETTIRASVIGMEEKVFDDFVLTVEEPRLDIYPGADFVLSVGESKELETLYYSCGVTWGTDKPGVVTLEDKGLGVVEVTAIGPGTRTVYAECLTPCGGVMRDSLRVAVTDSKGLVVQAKLGNCDWMEFCNLGKHLGPVPLTVRAGVIEGEKLTWKERLTISVSGGAGRPDPGFGTTDAEGNFYGEIDGAYVDSPYVIASVSAFVPGGPSSDQVTVGAISSLVCLGGPDEIGTQVTPGCNCSPVVSIGQISINASSSCSVNCDDYNYICGNSHCYGSWLDTILIVPDSYEHLGKHVTLTINVYASSSGDCHADSSLSGANVACFGYATATAGGVQYESYCTADGYRNCNSRPNVSYNQIQTGGRLGMPIRIRDLVSGGVETGGELIGYCCPHCWYDASGSVSITAGWSTVSSAMLTVSKIPLTNFDVFSCSGRGY